MQASARTHEGPPPPPDEPAYTADQLEMNLSDRLNKSLRLSGMSIERMAQFIEVHRNTVGAWLAGKNTPSPASLKQWAIATNVPYEWLRHGPASKPADNDNASSRK